MTYLSHSGDCGDLFAALAALKPYGPFKLGLYPSTHTGYRMTVERVECLRPFLEAQPYVAGVEWIPEAKFLNLDGWRRHYRNGFNLCDMLATWLDLPHPGRRDPWFTVDEPNRVAPVVIARSGRYHYRFPWRLAVKKYKECAVFVGHQDEYDAFAGEWGHIPYYKTANFLDLARVIAGAYLVCCNQSSPLWLAEGFKIPTCYEENPSHKNCHWDRPGHVPIIDELAALPDVDDLEDRWKIATGRA